MGKRRMLAPDISGANERNDFTKLRFLLPIPRKALNSLTLACLIFFHYCNSNILMFLLCGFCRIISYISQLLPDLFRAFPQSLFERLLPRLKSTAGLLNKTYFSTLRLCIFSSTALHHQGNANQKHKVRYHLTPVRLSSRDDWCWRGCGEKRTLWFSLCPVGGPAIVENHLEIPQKN